MGEVMMEKGEDGEGMPKTPSDPAGHNFLQVPNR